MILMKSNLLGYFQFMDNFGIMSKNTLPNPIQVSFPSQFYVLLVLDTTCTQTENFIKKLHAIDHQHIIYNSIKSLIYLLSYIFHYNFFIPRVSNIITVSVPCYLKGLLQACKYSSSISINCLRFSSSENSSFCIYF